jgi:hypothetical protein
MPSSLKRMHPEGKEVTGMIPVDAAAVWRCRQRYALVSMMKVGAIPEAGE